MMKSRKILVVTIVFILISISMIPIFSNNNQIEQKSTTSNNSNPTQNHKFEKELQINSKFEQEEKYLEEFSKEIPLNNKEIIENENTKETQIIKETQSSKLGTDWLEAENITKTIKVPAGVNYNVYFENDTLYDMQYIDRTVGLHQQALDAIKKVPDWLKDDLADKFGELANEDLDVDTDSKPGFADLDGDGDFDLTVGGSDVTLYYYRNAGTDFYPIFIEYNTMFENIDVGSDPAPTFVDFDFDGDYDLFLGNEGGTIHFIENIGTQSKPEWNDTGEIVDNNNITIDVGNNAIPALADMEGDGDYDLTIGSRDNMLYYYENINGIWIYEGGMYNSISPMDYVAPALEDLDDDGDFELTLGEGDGDLHYYEDLGTSGHLWVEDTSIYGGIGEKPIKVDAMSNPAFTDINGDSIYDLFVGQTTGILDYFRNGGTARDPHFLDMNSGLIYNEETQNQMLVTIPALALAERQIVQMRNPNSVFVTDYAAQINNEELECSDEIGFSIANTATRVLKSVYPGIFGENARLIYENAPELNYVDIVEKDSETDDFYTTLSYKVNESGVINEYELPKDIYYWYVVHPKITDEDPTYIDPNTGDPAQPLDGGRFWREYLYNHVDAQYPYENADDEHEYPHDMNPPLLKEQLEDIEFIWYGIRSRTSNGHNNAGLDNKRWFDARYRILYANMTENEWQKRWLGINTGTDNDLNSLDRKNVTEPCVIKIAPFDYKMWYSGFDGENYRIFYATSDSWDGRSWTKQGLALNVGVGNELDNIHVRNPTVMYDINENIYKMWYSGYDRSNYRIFYATSEDGEIWEKQGIAVDLGDKEDYDGIHATEPMVIKEIDGYTMYYSGFDGKNYRILYATSFSGENWKKEGIAIDYNQSLFDYDSQGVTGAAVIVEEYDDDYKMWFTGIGEGVSRILYASSNNGESWNYEGLALDVGTNDRFPQYGRFDYPEAISPTVIRDIVDTNVTYKMWYSGLDGFHDQALEQVSNWVAKTLPLNQQEVDDDERPIQPVRIAHHHNGNCGELQDLGISSGRTALIPSVGAHDLAEDHVWMQFWDRGWHQWDTWWSDSATITDDFDQYKYGWGKDISAIWTHRGDDHVFDVTQSYIHAEDIATVNVKVVDRFGNPVDGARVIFGSHWLSENNQQSIEYGGQEFYVAGAPFLSFWNYTDSNGECVFYLGFNNYSVDVMSRFGSQGEYHLTQNNGGMPLEKGRTYNFEYVLDGAVPRPNNPITNKINVQSGKDYKIEVDYKVLKGEQRVPNLLEGNYHPQNIPTNNDIDLYICDESNYQRYLRGYLDFECVRIANDSKSRHITFTIPEGNDTWYIIFSNTQPTQTTKIIEIEIKKFVRDFSIDIENPVSEAIFMLGQEVNISGTVDGIVSLIEVNINNDENWYDITNIDDEDWFYILNTKNLDAGNHLITVRASAGGSRYKYADVSINLWAITIENPNNGSKYDIGKIIQINGDTTEYIELDRVELSIDGNDYVANYNSDLSRWDYDFDTSKLLPGFFNIDARAYYNGIKEKVSINIDLQDLSYPTIILTEPENDVKFSSEAIVIIKGTASDNSGIYKVEVKIDDDDWKEGNYDTETENWDYNWNTKGVSIGEHTIYAHSIDNYGHISQQASATVEIIDDVKPDISIDEPKNGKEFGVGDYIEILGKAVDNYGIDKVQMIIGENTETANFDTNSAEWTYYWDTTEMNLGEYEITAKALDKAENYNSASISLRLIDKTLPYIKIHEHLDNSSVSLGDIKTISGTVTDNIEITSVEININGTWSNASFIDDIWSFKWNTTNFTLGKFKIYAKAIDTSNNSKLSQEFTIFIVDETPPVLTIYKPQNNGIGELITLKGSAVDITEVEKIKINIPLSTGVQWKYQWKYANYNSGKQEWTYTWNTDRLEPKKYNIKVTATDIYDNEEEASINIELIDITPPEIQFLKPKNNAKFEAGEIIEFEGTVEDDTVIDIIEISYENDKWKSVTLDDESWTYEWDTIGEKAEKYKIIVRAIDSNGNENNASINIVITGDDESNDNNNTPIAIGIIAIVVIFALVIKLKSKGYSNSNFDERYKKPAKEVYKRPPPKLEKGNRGM